MSDAASGDHKTLSIGSDLKAVTAVCLNIKSKGLEGFQMLQF